ncbi:hypothetical protein DFJ58DRAFT_887471 [Suillus subalutaceus]|uniref:uncharacterized protein n=1 Tax=Suillus subalutaceus TaxID=48586 RepID=UPI001B871510|nr:uncharacterized protein DFJ58DRAFT_887471 [Suillus subalutaceus]KAG1872339.1 hypothetical protein DFJ58DRAFT_887471 [Suillus subalutaceus]
MEPTTQLSFPFGDLPVELALLILKHAAQPSFSQTEPYRSKNPYSFALALCLVSKEVRKTVLPEILHTVLLPQFHNVTAFVDALRMQEAYAQQGHQFKFDYTKYIRRMWLGRFNGSLPGPSLTGLYPNTFGSMPPGPDLSLLAPVLLAVPSIAVDFENVGLLSGCLFYASKSRVDNHEGSPALYDPKTLTVTGFECMTREWSSFTKTVHGAAFLASLSHVISITYTMGERNRHVLRLCHFSNQWKIYQLPKWMERAPLRSLQTFSLPIPHSAHRLAECELSSTDMKVEVSTFSVSKLSSRQRTLGIRTIRETMSFNGPLALSYPGRSSSSCILCQDWLQAWACGLGT